MTGIRHGLRLDPRVIAIVIRVPTVPVVAVRQPLDRRSGGWCQTGVALDPGARGGTPGQRIDHLAATDTEHDGAARSSQATAVRLVGERRERTRRVGQQQARAWLDHLLLPARLAGQRAAGRRDVDQLQAAEVSRQRAPIVDLDPFVRSTRATRDHLAHDQVRGRPPGPGRAISRTRRRTARGGERRGGDRDHETRRKARTTMEHSWDVGHVDDLPAGLRAGHAAGAASDDGRRLLSADHSGRIGGTIHLPLRPPSQRCLQGDAPWPAPRTPTAPRRAVEPVSSSAPPVAASIRPRTMARMR